MNPRFSRALGALVAFAALTACQSAGGGLGGGGAPPNYGAFEDQLAAAGFVMKPANTPQRQEMLGRLPAHQFVTRTGKNGALHYLWPDPLVCDCLYLGTQQQYDRFQKHQIQEQIATEQQLAAVSYYDSAWNWGAWGPWGPDTPSDFMYDGPPGW
jgi:hypothetical protein